MTNPVTAIPAAPPSEAAAHFGRLLRLETDCADVHAAMAASGGVPSGFVLLDVRGPGSYARGHVPGAINLPRGRMTPDALAAWPAGTLFVAYCAGPHCNGADRAALHLSRMGRPVKLMLGGAAGWADEGFGFVSGEAPGALGQAA